VRPAALATPLARLRVKPTWPTVMGIVFLVAILLTGFAGIVHANNLHYLIVAAMLGVLTVSGILAELTLHALAVRITPPVEVFAGRETMLRLALTNAKAGIPSYCLGVREGTEGPFGTDRCWLPHVAPGATVETGYAVEFPTRGWHAVDGVWVATCFPFMLCEKATYLACPTRVLVFPSPDPAPPVAAADTPASGSTPRASRGLGSGVASLRDFSPTDPYRLIHWRRSARTGSLKVKDLERDDERRVTLVMAPAAAGPALEASISLVAGVLLDLSARSIPFSLVTHAGRIGAASGRDHVQTCLAHLALLVPAVDPAWEPGPDILSARPARDVVVVHAAPGPPEWATRAGARTIAAGERSERP
jgi:uncharacterized protein (DUF58 family)